MELTQKDFDERVARNAAGNGTDEDLRLIEHYQANGFTPNDKARAESEAQENSPAEDNVTDIKPSRAKR